MKRKYFYILAMLFILSGNVRGEDMNKVILKGENKNSILYFPLNYKILMITEGTVSVHLSCPEMTPKNPHAVSDEDSIILRIEIDDNSEFIEKFIKRALPSYNPQRPGLQFYAGKKNGYDLYKRMRSKSETNYYVFKAEDGMLVRISDGGTYSKVYNYRRKLNEDIYIRYIVSKYIKDDFNLIDKRISDFAKLIVKN